MYNNLSCSIDYHYPTPLVIDSGNYFQNIIALKTSHQDE
jgi:hypothetical protein